MGGNYEKFIVPMEMKNDEFRLWKKGNDEAFCVLETYKEKRSVFLSVANMLPSSHLRRDDLGEYHFLLLGADEHGMIHQDFGVFFVNQKGEGSFFQRFIGPDLNCYSYCLLVLSKEENLDPVVIYSGETPFNKDHKKIPPWIQLINLCTDDHESQPFSLEIDETKCKWYRIDVDRVLRDELPKPVTSCLPMIESYGHLILGRNGERWFLGVPGRFLQKEQPCRETGWFLLWQPVRGGEAFYHSAEEMTKKEQERIFGYWIAEVNVETDTLSPM